MDKVTRVLCLYGKLIRGDKVNKTLFCFQYGCSQRSFDRDIEDVRLYLSESYGGRELRYDRTHDVYFIEGTPGQLLELMEFEFVARMLRDTAPLRRDELHTLLDHLAANTENRPPMPRAGDGEPDNYASPLHDKALLKMHGDLSTVIRQKRCIELDYIKFTGQEVKYRILPCLVKYDLGYLYLIGYRLGEEYPYPAYYRLDRIYSFTLDRAQTEEEQEKISDYVKNYSQGIIQMYGGKYIDLRLRCRKEFFPYIYDKFRTAKVVDDDGEMLTVGVCAFEDGFVKWLLSQPQEMCTVVEPESTRQKLREIAEKLMEKYGVQ